MEKLILREIEAEAKKRLGRHSKRWHYIGKYRAAFTKRTGQSANGSSATIPASWGFHRQFDPRYCLNHSSFLAKGIWAALEGRVYKPIASLRIEIPKNDGKSRVIDSFSVTDAAIARIFFRNLRYRNSKIFSDASYAYKVQKTPIDAVIRLKSALSSQGLFVSQYDFSSYFDTISHDFLDRMLSKDGAFLTTSMERQVISAVLCHEFRNGAEQGVRECGIPQGHSLSLFLANVAAHWLDVRLGQLGGSFARFADDSVVVNMTYEDALKTADAYRAFSKTSGVRINTKKSSGIRIYSSVPSEMETVKNIDFLSYKFQDGNLNVSESALRAIKRRCSRIVYNNLILHLKRTKLISDSRIGDDFVDWDLVTCVNELRAYIYGAKSQRFVDDALNGTISIKNFAGAVSYFALVDTGSEFRRLDGWLASLVLRGFRERQRLLVVNGLNNGKYLTIDQLLDGSWYSFKKIKIETKMPSFLTAWRLAKKTYSRHGLGGIDSHGMGYSYP